MGSAVGPVVTENGPNNIVIGGLTNRMKRKRG